MLGGLGGLLGFVFGLLGGLGDFTGLFIEIPQLITPGSVGRGAPADRRPVFRIVQRRIQSVQQPVGGDFRIQLRAENGILRRTADHPHEVHGDPVPYLGDVLLEFDPETHLAGKGVVRQHPLAETVDGHDGRLIEIHQGRRDQFTALTAPFRRLALFLDDVADLIELGRLYRVFVLLVQIERPSGRHQNGMQPGHQFLGGEDGEGHHQDLPQGDPLQHQPQDQQLDVVGLSGARARLDQIYPVERTCFGIEFIHFNYRNPSVLC